MGDLSTYSLVDFVPFTSEVYARMFVRLNEAVWPAHVVAVGLGVVLLWLLRRGRGAVVGIGLAAVWAWVGWSYHLNFYAELNWVAVYFGWGSLAQGAVVLGAGLLGRLDRPEDDPFDPVEWFGLGLVGFAVLLFPGLAPLAGRSWLGVELFGLAPDPTVLATLGAALTAGRVPWAVFPIPLLWCVVTGATGWVIGAPGALLTAALGPVALAAAVAKAVHRK